MIHTNIIAKVEKYNDGIADLAPLFLDEDEQPYEKIVNARALKHSFKVEGVTKSYEPVYSKGDIVLVAIPERDYSDAIEGKRGNGGSEASHELTSAVIVGKVM